MCIREPFFGGVSYYSPETEMEVVGYYQPTEFEHECSDWWLNTKGHSYSLTTEEVIAVLQNL
jgi:hypothetical protein